MDEESISEKGKTDRDCGSNYRGIMRLETMELGHGEGNKRK